MAEDFRPPMEFIDLAAQRRRIGDRINSRINDVLAHGKFILGPEVNELESRLGEWAGVEHVVACSSGTAALTLPLLALGIGPGDAVFVPSFTFTATAEVVALAGATPVFCDVNSASYNLSVESLRNAIEFVDNRGALRLAAVIPVDLFGLPADYPAIQELAADHGMHVIADAAQSFGGTMGGRPVGGFGTATATSFFPAKPLGGLGDGGAVLTRDGNLADIMRSLRVHGKGADKYDTIRVGLNARLDTIQAAVLLAKLDIFADELVMRRVIAEVYHSALVGRVAIPDVPGDRSSTWAQYTVCVEERDRVAAALKRVGVPTAIYYPRPLHHQPAFTSLCLTPDGCQVSEQLAGSVLSLPMHPYLTRDDQRRVVSALIGVVDADS